MYHRRRSRRLQIALLEGRRRRGSLPLSYGYRRVCHTFYKIVEYIHDQSLTIAVLVLQIFQNYLWVAP